MLVSAMVCACIIIMLITNRIAFSEPVKTRLVSLEAAFTILKLSIVLYPAGAWVHTNPTTSDGEGSQTSEVIEESWNLRSGLSQWAWRAITELREDDEETSELQPFCTYRAQILTE